MRKGFLPLLIGSIIPQGYRPANVDFDTRIDDIVRAEIADRKNRAKFPSKKERLQAMFGKRKRRHG